MVILAQFPSWPPQVPRVGLGAIWFPYVTTANGGGAFLLVFLLFSFTWGGGAEPGRPDRQPGPARGGGGLW